MIWEFSSLSMFPTKASSIKAFLHMSLILNHKCSISREVVVFISKNTLPYKCEELYFMKLVTVVI